VYSHDSDNLNRPYAEVLTVRQQPSQDTPLANQGNPRDREVETGKQNRCPTVEKLVESNGQFKKRQILQKS
jgi:hypothetical protein